MLWSLEKKPKGKYKLRRNTDKTGAFLVPQKFGAQKVLQLEKQVKEKELSLVTLTTFLDG